jgi:hypothetical protein
VGPWAKAFVEALGGGEAGEAEVRDLRVEPGMITARVGREQVTLAADPIGAGIWAALDPIDTRHQSQGLAQQLEHTWEEPLIPSRVGRVGSEEAVAAVVSAVAAAIDDDPATLLRWRGHGERRGDSSDAWRGGALPELPESRRPPESVPNRFGSSGIHAGDGDLVEQLVHAYRAFGS